MIEFVPCYEEKTEDILDKKGRKYGSQRVKRLIGYEYKITDAQGKEGLTYGIRFENYCDALDFYRYAFHGADPVRNVMKYVEKIVKADEDYIAEEIGSLKPKMVVR